MKHTNRKESSFFVLGGTHLSRYVILLLIAMVGFCSWNVADTAGIKLSLFPAPFLVVIYIGYRFGRLPGALAGLLCQLPLAILAYCYLPLHRGQSIDLVEMVLGWRVDVEEVRIHGCSLQYAIGLAGIGYLAGLITEKMETALSECGTTLADLFPVRTCWYAGCSYEFLRRLLQKQVDSLKVDGRQITLQERITLILKTSLIGSLVPLVVLLGYSFDYHPTVFLTIQFPPYGSPSVALVLIALLTGPRLSVLIAVIAILVMSFVGLVFQEQNMVSGPFYFYGQGVWTPFQVFGVGIACWWIGRLHWLINDDARRKQLSEAVAPLFGAPRQAEAASFLHLIVIVLSATTVAWATKTSSEPHFGLHLGGFNILFPVVAVMSLTVDGRSLSNRLLLTLPILYMVTLNYYFSINFSVGTWQPDAVAIILLVLTPLAVERLRRDTLWGFSMFLLGGLAVYLIGQLYLYWILPSDFFIEINLTGYSFWLVELVLTIGAYLLVARLMWWLARGQGEKQKVAH